MSAHAYALPMTRPSQLPPATELLVQWREENGLTRGAAARFLGIQWTRYTALEDGDIDPSFAIAQLLRDRAGIPLDAWPPRRESARPALSAKPLTRSAIKAHKTKK